ncbi:MAG: GIY-YIG nuclease family protein [Armatimonadota bacterium]
MARSTALYRRKAELQALLKQLPTAPGIYRFYDAAGKLVYVGKSVCLRDRVRSYFTGKPTTKKLRRMRQEIAALDWEETGSELEALLLESRLVKLHQPRFNVLLKDFTPLPYVRVDLADPFPMLEVTRAPQRDGATYFGPFRNQTVLEAGVGALADALKLRSCEGPGTQIRRQRPCYRYDFGTCSAPCLGEAGAPQYDQAVDQACGVFDGREQGVLDALRQRMERAAERMQFEIAARLRDAMKLIQAVSGRQQAVLSATQELSLIVACPSVKAETLCLFVFRSGHLVLNAEAPLAELRAAKSRRGWTARLLESWSQAQDPAPGSRIDTALLDEIQIITAWMKQKTRQGAYWPVPQDRKPREMARELESWLAEQVGVEVRRLAA